MADLNLQMRFQSGNSSTKICSTFIISIFCYECQENAKKEELQKLVCRINYSKNKFNSVGRKEKQRERENEEENNGRRGEEKQT